MRRKEKKEENCYYCHLGILGRFILCRIKETGKSKSGIYQSQGNVVIVKSVIVCPACSLAYSVLADRKSFMRAAGSKRKCSKGKQGSKRDRTLQLTSDI